MEPITLLWGLIGLLAMLLCGYWPDQRRIRILEEKSEFLRAKVRDMRKIFVRLHRGKKRVLDKDLSDWIDEGQKLVRKAECLIGQVGERRGFFRSAKVTREVDKLVDDLQVHDKKSGELLTRATSGLRVPCRGQYLPVKEVVGQSASNTLEQLELLLLNDDVQRIAICGGEGVGKTFLMKHLHNSALNQAEKFDHVLWVTLQDQSTIKLVQDAIAAAVNSDNCDLTGVDDLNVRANKLSDSLSGPICYALFLDGVGADFSFNQVGIPVPGEGNKCKLIITTSLSMESSLFDHFEAVKVDPLQEEEAYQLFMYEADAWKGCDPSLAGISRLLADACCGVPQMIVNIATRMFGIDDIHEWRHALYELGLENKVPLEGVIRQLKFGSRKPKRN